MGSSLTPDERFEVFGTFVPEDYEAEVNERWGGTRAYDESQRRVGTYTKEDWLRIKAAGEEVSGELVRAMTEGLPATSERAMHLAEQHRQHITRRFYDCSYEIHRGLGEMYMADPRFTAFYDQLAPGLAGYLRTAIVANADRAEGK